MRKHQTLKNILESETSNEAKATQLVTLLNNAIISVAEDLFSDLKNKGLLSNEEKAKSVKQILLGQVTQPDYPELN